MLNCNYSLRIIFFLFVIKNYFSLNNFKYSFLFLNIIVLRIGILLKNDFRLVKRGKQSKTQHIKQQLENKKRTEETKINIPPLKVFFRKCSIISSKLRKGFTFPSSSSN